LTHRHNWSNFKASNMGIDGDTTDGVLSRLHLTSKAETIVLMIGANDILKRTPMHKIQKNYTAILESFSPGQKVYVLSILPVIDYKQTRPINQDILTLNRWLKDKVNRGSMTFVNLHPYFLEGKGLKDDLGIDGLHLSSAGYKLWEKLLKEALKK